MSNQLEQQRPDGLGRRIAEYVMRGRRQAVVMALIPALVAYVAIPLLISLSIVIVCLVTLRKGAKEGLIVLLSVFVPGTCSD